jgi:hypothetical protein
LEENELLLPRNSKFKVTKVSKLTQGSSSGLNIELGSDDTDAFTDVKEMLVFEGEYVSENDTSSPLDSAPESLADIKLEDLDPSDKTFDDELITLTTEADLTEEQTEALIKYTGDNWYSKINSYLRTGSVGGLVSEIEKTQKESVVLIKSIDEAIEKTSLLEDTVLYRGTSALDGGGEFGRSAKEILNNLENNKVKTLFEKGFVSTSYDYEIGNWFGLAQASSNQYDEANDIENSIIVYKINAKKGQKALQVKDGNAAGSDEKEIMLPRDTEFKVLGYTHTKSDPEDPNTYDEFVIELDIVDSPTQAEEQEEEPAKLILPLPPRSLPIPEGHVRLFHYTNDSAVESIRKNGLIAQEEGASVVDDNVGLIWAMEGAPVGGDEQFNERPVVEFHVPKEVWEKGAGLGFEKTAMNLPVPPENILSIHEPWHDVARLLLSYSPEEKKKTLDIMSSIPSIRNSYENKRAIDYVEGLEENYTIEPQPEPVEEIVDFPETTEQLPITVDGTNSIKDGKGNIIKPGTKVPYYYSITPPYYSEYPDSPRTPRPVEEPINLTYTGYLKYDFDGENIDNGLDWAIVHAEASREVKEGYYLLKVSDLNVNNGKDGNEPTYESLDSKFDNKNMVPNPKEMTKVTKNQAKSLNRYTGGESTAINKYLNDGVASISSDDANEELEIIEDIENIDEAINNAPGLLQDENFYRGARIPEGVSLEDFLKNLNSGDIESWLNNEFGFSSFSSDYDIANSFGVINSEGVAYVVYRIKAKKGQKVYKVPSFLTGWSFNEFEALFPRKQRRKLLNYKYFKGDPNAQRPAHRIDRVVVDLEIV